MSCLFIDDGLTLDGVIPARPGLHPALAFTYRPATAAEVQRYLNALARGDERDPIRATVRLVEAHLVEWEAKGKGGEPLPLSEAALRRLRHQVLQGLADHVCGYVASGEADDDAGNS
jgi:hypothetical protein